MRSISATSRSCVHRAVNQSNYVSPSSGRGGRIHHSGTETTERIRGYQDRPAPSDWAVVAEPIGSKGNRSSLWSLCRRGESSPLIEKGGLRARPAGKMRGDFRTPPASAHNGSRILDLTWRITFSVGPSFAATRVNGAGWGHPAGPPHVGRADWPTWEPNSPANTRHQPPGRDRKGHCTGRLGEMHPCYGSVI